MAETDALAGVLKGLDINTMEELDARVKAVLEASELSEDLNPKLDYPLDDVTTPVAPVTEPYSAGAAWRMPPITPESDCSTYSAFYDSYHPGHYQDRVLYGEDSDEEEEAVNFGDSSVEKENMAPSNHVTPLHGFGASTPEVFEHKLHMLASSLEAVEARSEMLAARVEASESESKMYAAQAADKDKSLTQFMREARAREEALLSEVARLQGVMEAQSLSHEVAEETLRHMISSERRNADRLRTERDEALRQRTEALVELGETGADMEAMQAALTDCATYCHFLRERCTELEAQTASLSSQASRSAQQDDGVFGLSSTREAIQKAVKATAGLSAGERKKQIRQLQLRWHPDKNPVLKEFAGEVSKLINEAASELEAELAVEERVRVDG